MTLILHTVVSFFGISVCINLVYIESNLYENEPKVLWEN